MGGAAAVLAQKGVSLPLARKEDCMIVFSCVQCFSAVLEAERQYQLAEKQHENAENFTYICQCGCYFCIGLGNMMTDVHI